MPHLLARRALQSVVATTLVFGGGVAATAQDTTASDTANDPAIADGFDTSMSGQWTGGGEVLQKIDDERPLNVKCTFDMNAQGPTFDLDGECGVLFMKRAIKLSLERDGNGVSGIYDAKMRTGEAALAGDFNPDNMDLDIAWGGDVNGDRDAKMLIERPDADTLRIRVVDYSPTTEKDVVTSDLTLTREG